LKNVLIVEIIVFGEAGVMLGNEQFPDAFYFQSKSMAGPSYKYE